MIGTKHGELTVLGTVCGSDGRTRFSCRCDCGKTTLVKPSPLCRGIAKSCGCNLLKRNRSTAKHGDVRGNIKTKEYSCWLSMKHRCSNPKAVAWKYYGGRGITVCERWQKSFADFLADVGRAPTPAHTIDRWPDNNGNYEPGNVRWATRKEQIANRRCSKLRTAEPCATSSSA